MNSQATKNVGGLKHILQSEGSQSNSNHMKLWNSRTIELVNRSLISGFVEGRVEEVKHRRAKKLFCMVL